METLLYQKVFETAFKIKSAKNLGQLSSFVAKAISEKYQHLTYDVVSTRTIKRGFQEFLSPQLLEPFNKDGKAEDKTEEKKKYTPDLKTLNLLAEYLEYESFADFSSQNKKWEEPVDKESEQDSTSSVIVNQHGNNPISYGDINTEGDITFNL